MLKPSPGKGTVVSNDLVELGRFPSSAEACLVRSQLECEGIRAELAGEAAASWLWHFGTAIGGVRLLVQRVDVERAMQIIGSVGAIDDMEAVDFGDESEELATDDARPELPGDLVRAWRASLIGVLLLPPILNVYSIWLLFRHDFFIGRCRNWRVAASCTVNAMVLGLVVLIMLLIWLPREPLPEYFAPDGQPVHKTLTIPIVP